MKHIKSILELLYSLIDFFYIKYVLYKFFVTYRYYHYYFLFLNEIFDKNRMKMYNGCILVLENGNNMIQVIL